jgi:PAS domain S-box-containing protein
VSEAGRSEGERHHDLAVMRQRLELAIEGARLGIFSFNPHSGTVWFSNRGVELFELDGNFVEDARELKKRIHPDDWMRFAAPYYGRFPDQPLAIEYRLVLKDGSIRWIYALGAAVRDAQGVAQAVHGINIDITERKRADDELAATRRQLDLAVEGAKLGIWTVDPETGATWYSDRSRDMHGLDKELRLDAKTLKAYIHPDDWELVLDSYRKDFPGDAIELEHRVVWPNGDVRWVQSIGTALRGPDGRVHTVSGIHLDITDRKQAEAELARSRDALQQSEKLASLGALLAGVSHELNNPLAAIVGQAEMLQEDARGTQFEERARKIGAAAERSARIVQTFLGMARRREAATGLVDMNALIAAALEITEYGLRTAAISVRVNLGTGLPPVEGDRDQLHQVLVNLIVNAQQAMEKGEAFEKVLTLRTSVNQAGQILIDVADTGPGIPEKLSTRIFEPFFSTKRPTGGAGTGIGLSFSQGIVEAHRGTIQVEPSKRGAHFRIALPPAPGAPAPVVTPSARFDLDSVAELLGGRRKALVVEDEPDVADTLKELIEREGYEVTVASNGTEAFFALDHDEFDLLFSDLRMPLLNGPELHARLLEIRPELVRRMAFVSGDTMGDQMGEFLKRAGRPILEKPFTKAGVRAVLAALIVAEGER